MRGDAEIHKVVALAIELIECSMKAVDASKDAYGSFRASGYSARDWALDTLKQLPDDRESALMIIKVHTPGVEDFENRRIIGRLCRAYYDRLSRSGLLNHGKMLLDRFS